jgi:hypothetical protein
MQPNLNPSEADCLNYTTIADLTVVHETSMLYNMSMEF